MDGCYFERRICLMDKNKGAMTYFSKFREIFNFSGSEQRAKCQNLDDEDQT